MRLRSIAYWTACRTDLLLNGGLVTLRANGNAAPPELTSAKPCWVPRLRASTGGTPTAYCARPLRIAETSAVGSLIMLTSIASRCVFAASRYLVYLASSILPPGVYDFHSN